VIDTGTYSVVDKIAAELAPDTVTVSWDGARLYATHWHKNAISIIELETRAITRRGVPWCSDRPRRKPGRSIRIHNQSALASSSRHCGQCCQEHVRECLPRATRLSADGKWAYVLDFDQQTIWALDTADNSVAGTLDVGGHPEAMALGPVANSFMSQTIWMALPPSSQRRRLSPRRRAGNALGVKVLRCVDMLTTIWMPVSSLLVDTPPVHRHRRLIHLHKDFPNSTYKPVVGRNHFVNYQLVKRDAGRASVRPCLTWHLVIGGPLCLLSGPTGSDRLHTVMWR